MESPRPRNVLEIAQYREREAHSLSAAYIGGALYPPCCSDIFAIHHLRQMVLTQQPVYSFSITGAPSCGKTTALSHLLSQHGSLFPGFNVDVVPEAATLYHQYGARLPFAQPPSRCGRITAEGRNLLWEMLLNELKRSLEARSVNAALVSPRPSIVLCDRGIFDSQAYLDSKSAWLSMLELGSWSEAELAARYDHCFHLKPCPRAAYSNENNEARRESYEEALELDQKTWDAWESTHASSHSLIGGPAGDDTLEAKLDALVEAMQARVATGVEADACWPPPTYKRRSWYLPPESIIALADTVAASPDLSKVAPTALSIVRRVQRIDRRLPQRQGNAADAVRETSWRLAAAIGRDSGLRRDIDEPLAF